MRNITIITGASSGLGKEFAKQLYSIFIKEPINREIWLIARSENNLLTVKSDLNNTDFLKIRIFAIDISGTQGSQKFKNLIEEENKKSEFKIEYLINNAGFGTYGPFEETPTEKEMEMIELNCVSLTGICSYSLPYLKRNSNIINVSSLAAFMPLGNFAVYAASKSYVLSFTIALASELKDKGIKVSALCPGSVSTNFANIASNGARKEVLHGKDPKKVVKHCIKKAKKGKIIILWATKWKITAFFSRIIGRYLVARYTYLYNKRPYLK